MNYDEKLALAREDIARRDALKSQLQALYRAQKLLSDQKNQLEEARLREEKDVKRLEGFSLDAVFSLLSGRKEEKLEKERREARDAALDYEQALRQLEETEAQIRITEEELSSLRGCGRAYRLLLNEKKAAVKSSASPAAERIAALEGELARMKTAWDRLREAADAGTKALAAAYSALEFHGEVVSGNSLTPAASRIRRTIEESRLVADAQAAAVPMQAAVSRFGALLKALDIPAVSAPEGDVPYSPAVPYLFTRIGAGFSMDKIEKTQAQIRAALDSLGRLTDENAAACARIRARLDDEILNAVLPQPGAAQSDD